MRNRILSALFIALFAWTGAAHATAWTMPTLPFVGPTDQSSKEQGDLNYGGSNTTGSIKVTAIGTPSAPTLTTNGTAGVTSLIYACTGVDINGNATIPSSTATITTANATLSTTNSVNITCPGKTGALAFLIHKADTAHVIGICPTQSGVACTFIDDASANTVGHGGGTSYTYTANTVDQTGTIAGNGSQGAPVKGVVTMRIGATNVPSPVTMCTTTGLGGVCAEPTAVLVPGFADTNYSVNCTGVLIGTNVPLVQSVSKASNGIVVTISGQTAPSASFSEVDCVAVHD